MNAPSTLVSDRFLLGELLGKGGSASVFSATEVRTGASIALKILHPHLSERPAAREAFLAEARRAAPLRHPNIVGVLDVGVDERADGPVAWIALERAAGTTLSEHVARGGPLPPRHAAAVADGVLSALGAAHAIRLIHRDVSPSNVMIAPESSGALTANGVRLLDFGLADATGTTALGTDELLSERAEGRSGIMGNVNYMSPEHVRGMPVDERGDVYQVGALLHFALTGVPPFPRETTGQTMRAHLDSPPPAPSASNGCIPRAFDRIVVRAMLKDPADRFATAAAMRAAVGELFSEAGVAPPVPRFLAAPAPSAPPAPEATAPGPAAVPASVMAAASIAPKEADGPPTEPDSAPDVTRVLGRTMVPVRTPGTVTGSTAAVARRRPRRARKQGGAWLAAAASAVVIAAVVFLSSASEPTASGEPEPSASIAPPPVAAPQPSAEPDATVAPVSTVAVPQLARLSLAEATAALAGAGLAVGEVMLVDSPYPADVVLESSPLAGRRLAARSAVALTAATGANAIPDVAGRTRADAAAALQAAGFVPAFATRSAAADPAPGVILGTTPDAGTRLPVGEAVTVFEADPEDPRPTPTPTPTLVQPTLTPTPTSDPHKD
ncbi:serine/threonine protein kinase [Microbacterium trichothecenolyticum]|uniref:protein kinase domain-containing protein n=1 Tax=Microbacterium trichothecenolyticum TaxID=69370 RepID=UPI001C6F570B|nr:serine/threonine protein kinase [Microbacterium trichothecenolyticum]MBW9121229.1 serine/threonine protein kinase [Microbacterium trichothecenolyticum]